jgi:hypothetical protein
VRKASLWVVETTPLKLIFEPLQTRWANQFLVATGLMNHQKTKKKKKKTLIIRAST